MSHGSHHRAVLLSIFALFLSFFIFSSSEAAITLAWDKPETNSDGTPCTDLAGYKVYYDTDIAAAPYAGTGLVEGNSPITVPVSSLPDPTHPEFVLSGLSAGARYYLTVTAYDTSGNESGYSNAITVAGNIPPSAAITATPLQGSAPLTVSFSGTGTDTDGGVVAYAWNFGDGMSAASQNPTHTYTAPGSYTATITVTDDNGASSQNTVHITVTEPVTADTPPDGSGFDTSSGGTTEVFTFVPVADVSVSEQIPTVSFGWSSVLQVDGSPAKVIYLKFNVTGLSGAVRSVSLRLYCVDSSTSGGTLYSLSDTGWSENALTFSNRPPVDGQLLADVGPVNVGETVELDVTSAIHGSGVYSFAFVSANRDGADYSSRENSNHSPVLLIETASMQTAQISSAPESPATIAESPPAQNEPPTVQIVANPAEGIAPLAVAFSGSATDMDGTVVGYSWSFGDGKTALTANPSHAYDEAGSYRATLTVTDDNGATATATKTIVVSAPPRNTPPSVSASADPTSGPVPLTVNFSGSASDSDGSIASYLWSFGDGSASQSAHAIHQYKSTGDYTASLTVTDDQGAQTTRSIMIHVQESWSDGDTDLDGLTDAQEVLNGLDPHASDTDGDGLDDFAEWGSSEQPLDTDGDGIIDARDPDSDNDGKSDAEEGFSDADNDGAPNFIDSLDNDGPLGDQDHDGVSNSTEVTYMMNPNRSDSDGDGLSDGLEFGPLGWPLDSEGDETIDARDVDSDNDGKPDAQEGMGDADGDGALNYRDSVDTDGPGADQDGDGITNVAETNIGLNPNLGDSDGDGIPDLIETGIPNAAADTDNDGLTDGIDRDSDDDGVADAVEGYEDFDGDGLADRLDPRMATLLTDVGQRMALKIVAGEGRLTETGFVRDPIPDYQWEMVKRARFNGLSFEVREVPTGGSVGLMVMMDQLLHWDSRYWKFDPSVGYYEIPCTVSANRLSVTLRDGGVGDIDHLANGVIVDPAVIAVPDFPDATASFNSEAPGGGAGKGARRLFSHPSSFAAALSLALALVLIGALKRKHFL